jgi:hypothetical protein
MGHIITTILIRIFLHHTVTQCIPLFASVYLHVLLPLRTDLVPRREAGCKPIPSVPTVQSETCVHFIQMDTVLFLSMKLPPASYQSQYHLISVTEQTDPSHLKISPSLLNQAHLTLIRTTGITGLHNIPDITTLHTSQPPDRRIPISQLLPRPPLPRRRDQHHHPD